MAIGMTVAMIYLVAFLSPRRMTSPANDGKKAAKSKATMAAECAAELSNWSGGSRVLIDDVYFRLNRPATAMVGGLLSYRPER